MGGGAGRHTLGQPPTQNKAPGHGGGSSPLAPAVAPRHGCSSPPCPACAADNCVCSRIKAKGSAFICDNSSESRSPRVAPVGTTTGKPLLAATFANQLPGKKKNTCSIHSRLHPDVENAAFHLIGPPRDRRERLLRLDSALAGMWAGVDFISR